MIHQSHLDFFLNGDIDRSEEYIEDQIFGSLGEDPYETARCVLGFVSRSKKPVQELS